MMDLKKLDAIEGWLNPPAASLVLHMAAIQDARGIGGPMLEIGVHKGKFLALVRAATQAKLVGVQLCAQGHEAGLAAEIRANVAAVHGDPGRIEIIMADSSKLATDDLTSALGGKARLAHIDGSHEADYVHHDLMISAPTLCEGGLLVMDDSYNSGTPGVIEGICRFFLPGTPFAPFAQCYNKLFATTRSHHAQYLAATKQWLENGAPADVRDRTLSRVAANSAAGYIPRLFGCEVAIFL